MAIIADYHLHSPFSHDSKKMELEDLFKNATSRYIKEICITDHRDIKTPNSNGDNEPDHSALRKMVEELQPKYPDVVVKVGCEYSLHQNNADGMEQAIKDHNLNFVIASTHFSETMDFAGTMLKRPEYHETIHHNYLTTMYEALQNTTAYSVLGHFDFIERYNMDAPLDLNKHRDLVYAILKTVADNGKGIEINTAFIAMRSPTPHPRLEVLKMFKEVGGEIITVGSDSHNNQPLGYEFQMVPEYLKSAGFVKYCTFDGYDNPNFHFVDSITL